MDIAELLGPDLERWRSLRARSPAVAARRLAGRAAVRDLVQEHDLFAWRGYEPTGRGRKPAFVDARADFSIAHSADRMFVAIMEGGRIGVDIERVDPVFDSAALQRRMCSPTELMLCSGARPVRPPSVGLRASGPRRRRYRRSTAADSAATSDRSKSSRCRRLVIPGRPVRRRRLPRDQATRQAGSKSVIQVLTWL